MNALQNPAVWLLRTVLGLVAGFSLLAASVAMIGDRGLWNWASLLVLSPVFGFVATSIHELGHAVAAWRCRWVVERIVVWPIAYVPKKKAWSRAPGFARRGDVAGWVETHPRGPGGSTRQEIWILLGGVIANLLSAAVCFMLAELVWDYPVDAVLWAFAIFSIAMAIFNIMPWKMAGSASDGLQLWRLLHRSKKRKATGSQWNAPRKG